MIHQGSVFIYGSTDEAVVNTLNICFPVLDQTFSPLTSAESGFFREEIFKNTVPSDCERDDINYAPPVRRLHIKEEDYDEEEKRDIQVKEREHARNKKKSSSFSWNFTLVEEEFLVGSYRLGKFERGSEDEEEERQQSDGSIDKEEHHLRQHPRQFVSYKTPSSILQNKTKNHGLPKKRGGGGGGTGDQRHTLTEKEYKTCYKNLQSLVCNFVAIKQNPTHFDCNVGDRRRYNENGHDSKEKIEYVDEYYLKFPQLEEEFGPSCGIIYTMDLGLPFTYLVERQNTTPGEFHYETHDYSEYDQIYLNEKQSRIDKIEREYTRYLLKEKNKILNLFTLECTNRRPRSFVFYLPPQVEKFDLPANYFDDLEGADSNNENDLEFYKMAYALSVCFEIITHIFVLCGLENIQQVNGRQKICLLGKIFSNKTEEDMHLLNRAMEDLKKAHAKTSSSASFHWACSDFVHGEAFASSIIQSVYEFYNDDVKKEKRILDSVLIQNKDIVSML